MILDTMQCCQIIVMWCCLYIFSIDTFVCFLRHSCVAQGDLELAMLLEVTLISPILKIYFYFHLCVYVSVCMLHEHRCP